MKYIYLIMVLTLIGSARSQQIFGLSYDLAMPVGHTSSFIPNMSILGFGLDGRQMSGSHISFGITFHWNSFKDSGVDRILDEDGAFISLEDRTMDSFPILVSSHYYVGNPASRFRPFIGGNAGAYFIITRQYSGQGRITEKGWHFGLAPDVGIMAEFISEINILLTLRYNYAFKTGFSPAHSYLSIIIGFVSVSLF